MKADHHVRPCDLGHPACDCDGQGTLVEWRRAQGGGRVLIICFPAPDALNLATALERTVHRRGRIG